MKDIFEPVGQFGYGQDNMVFLIFFSTISKMACHYSKEMHSEVSRGSV